MRRFQDAKLSQTELAELFDVSKVSLNFWRRNKEFDYELIKNKKLYSAKAVEFIRNKKGVKSPINKIQVFGNIKGGTGKSTLATQFLMLASMMGYKCLAVDLDAQAHLTYQLGHKTNLDTLTIRNVLIENKPIQEVIISIASNLSIIPGTLELSMVEPELINKRKRDYILREALSKVSADYDLIVIDTNPAITMLNLSACVAADAVNIVCATDYLSFNGLKLMLDQLASVKHDFDMDLETRIIPNMFDIRNGMSQRALGAIQKHYGELTVDTVVRVNTTLKDMGQIQNSIFFVKKRLSGREDIINLTKELVI